jgi:probable HAF family extracellular repeat protein
VLNYPGATFTQALGLNNTGEVVGFYLDSASLSHGFVYSGGVFTPVDDPNGIGTTVINGVNDSGDIVGFYVDSLGRTDGFLGTP